MPTQNYTPVAENVTVTQKEEMPPIIKNETLQIKVDYPDEVYFWVNNLLIPQATLYNGSKFIPIREDQIRTFAGSFGPYFDDPSEHLTVTLCAELTKAVATPSCERVDTLYRENYVSFAKGYDEGEFIGGRVYKDYTAYYNVNFQGTQVAVSNKAVIRTTG